MRLIEKISERRQLGSESMESMLPPELWDRVIDHCRDDKPTLFACSLVRKSWLPRTRSILFLSPQTLSETTVAEFSLLLESPHCTIIPLVQAIAFLPRWDAGQRDAFLGALERTIARIQSSGGALKELSTAMVLPHEIVHRPNLLNTLSQSLTSFSFIVMMGNDPPSILEILSLLGRTLQTVNLYMEPTGFVLRRARDPQTPFSHKVSMPELRNLTMGCSENTVLPWFLTPGILELPRLTYLSLWLKNILFGEEVVQRFLNQLCSRTVEDLVIRFRYSNLPALDLSRFTSLRSIKFKGKTRRSDEQSANTYEKIVNIVATTPSTGAKLVVTVTDPSFELPHSASRLLDRVEWIIGKEEEKLAFETMVQLYRKSCTVFAPV
ncbi:hypothetical protein VNI00_004536 [Paramarasmius palmivorus]|uniref:F-box domain-containing protein n=1 Tax=Paramarasmius palmivorus TaxID=297713 RepID=A0AAW0DLP2_9AGAR